MMAAREIKLVVREADGSERPATAEEDLDCFMEFFREHQHDPSKPLPLWELVQALENEDGIGAGGFTLRSYRMVKVYCEREIAKLERPGGNRGRRKAKG